MAVQSKASKRHEMFCHGPGAIRLTADVQNTAGTRKREASIST